MLLMIPGPVQLHERIIKAMCRQMIYHRGEEFAEIMKYCVRALKPIFGLKDGTISIISGSGTAGVEAAIASFGKIRKILTIENGKFGERIREIAEKYYETEKLKFEWGKSIDLGEVEKKMKGCDAVAFVHNETSTGILNPAKEIAKIAKEHDALVIVDAITSAGGDYLKMDDWGIDVAITGTQKCLGAPPGLAIVAVKDEAWKYYNARNYYLDLGSYRKKLSELQTPFTPAIPLFLALAEALKIIEEEGLENRIKRHRTLNLAVRKWAVEAGLELFPEIDEYSSYSNTLTAIKIPNGITDSQLRNTLKKEYGIMISGGQDRVKGKIFRIAAMGNVGKFEVLSTLVAVEDVMRRFVKIKSSIEIAAETLRAL
ncbi:MAG: alanine--glyoxylate aminotransferase family protein [Archaeoglobaceae archaeon]|nr:alanine--glyoxylate aminotransferase family protein [Archaeoglobaceae archaeon]